MTETKSAPVGVLERGLLILSCFDEQHPRQKLHEVAERTKLDRATALRALKTLVEFGYLLRTADGVYSPGPTNLRLAALFTATTNIISRIQAPLDRISEQTGLTASFFTRSANERICLARDSVQRSISFFLAVGASIALEKGGSAAKVLRAYTEPGLVDGEEIRRAGLYISWGELHPQMASVAIPVHENSTFIGALAMTGFREELTMDKLADFASLAARELTISGLRSAIAGIASA